jgi:TonB family protein
MFGSNSISHGGGSGTNLSGMFGVAALVVIVGVFGGWLTLRSSSSELELNLPAATTALDTRAIVVSSDGSESLIEMAELAFAAGRIVTPEFDSALGYYSAALEQNPNNEDALDGVDRVVGYLMSQAETAIFQNDWDQARDYANTVLRVQPRSERAQDIMARSNRFERVQALTEQALAQFSAGRLVSPAGDNAAETYQEILEIDPQNQAANQGLNTVVQRLIANAQSSVIAGDMQQARNFIAQARELDAEASGLDEVERSSRQALEAAEDRRNQQDLIAASEALQEDRLMPPTPNNAYDLFNRVLERSPNSDAAQRGLRLVREALMDRARAYLAAGNINASREVVSDAERAGVSRDLLEALRTEILHAERFADSRVGRFDRVYTMAELEVLRQVPPEYPRLAAQRRMEGWVEVEFTVTETGEVRDPQVQDSSSSIFDRAAVAALDRWLFMPVEEDGRAVPVRAQLRFSFRPQ